MHITRIIIVILQFMLTLTLQPISWYLQGITASGHSPSTSTCAAIYEHTGY